MRLKYLVSIIQRSGYKKFKDWDIKVEAKAIWEIREYCHVACMV